MPASVSPVGALPQLYRQPVNFTLSNPLSLRSKPLWQGNQSLWWNPRPNAWTWRSWNPWFNHTWNPWQYRVTWTPRPWGWFWPPFYRW